MPRLAHGPKCNGTWLHWPISTQASPLSKELGCMQPNFAKPIIPITISYTLQSHFIYSSLPIINNITGKMKIIIYAIYNSIYDIYHILYIIYNIYEMKIINIYILYIYIVRVKNFFKYSLKNLGSWHELKWGIETHVS